MNWLEGKLAQLVSWRGYAYSVEETPSRLVARLDANENWLVPLRRVRAVLRAAASVDPREYPDSAVRELGARISRQEGLSEGCVVPCAGADQAIDLICQTFLRRGDRAVVLSPTFSMYGLRATIAGAEIVDVFMRPDFTLPLEELVAAGGKGGVVFACSPNNPTGTQFGEDKMRSLLESFPGLVVLDEAYVEFADFSLSKLAKEYRNLAVLRTFSKAFGLAGLRLGYLLANETWAPAFLEKVQYPYPVSSIAAAAALAMMKNNRGEVEAWTRLVKRERSWLTSNLRNLRDVTVIDSHANFLMVSLPLDSKRVHAELLREGITTRNLGRIMDLPNCLRVTVGTRRMNRALLRKLGATLKNEA